MSKIKSDIEIARSANIKPIGDVLAKVKIPDNLVKELNDYTDDIIKNKQKEKDLDWGKNLVGNVKQEFITKKFLELSPFVGQTD